MDQTTDLYKIVNTFIDHKNLKLSKKQCFRIHIGKNHENCPDVMVHDEKMKDTESTKYLGDIIHTNGTIQATIESRQKKGEGIIAEILSIINEIPLGKHKYEVAMKLREAMLLNGILFNSEAWHGVTHAQIVKLEQIDEALLRGILKAHSKTPKEFLYLESGCTPIRYILAQRRINYLKNFLDRNDAELIKQVFLAQNSNPTQGDFVILVKKDLEMLGVRYEQSSLKAMSKKELKTIANNVAFKDLKELLNSHNKVKEIKYDDFELQPYLKTELVTSKEINMLTALRSHCVREIRCNFKKMYNNCVQCPLKCDITNLLEDTQEHILECKSLNQNPGNTLSDINLIYGTIEQQSLIDKQFCMLMRKREKLLEEKNKAVSSSLPGASSLDHSFQQHQQQGAPAVLVNDNVQLIG